MMNLEINLDINIDIVCDADRRETNPLVGLDSKIFTLDEAIRKYSELEYRCGLVLGWDAVP
ncbi:hypothetical protein [Desulfosporosinus metallidurans]|uniref:Uncharacterized protein n=1 Tax=Desulfosporosinus metallidurans TaxID=1888891 RepID=A0A1Q8QRG2_9FIRM|nr:hypothetical protein [Desulfosporosinus metallidurans]OLN29941.1 hypothetical protein DSOL_3281 [Desulfosporosinus metallidurans]